MTTTDLPANTTLPNHREAMVLATTEYQRFVDLLHDLSPADWTRPTDCSPWDVRAMVCHALGSMEANASLREMVRQMRIVKKRAKASGTQLVDEMTALQVAERSAMSPVELVTRVATIAPRAAAGRRRVPRVARRFVRIDTPPPFERMTLGYLCDTIFTRDLWMHRVDICLATGKDMELTTDHDGRLVAAIVGEWTTRHGQPYDLVLDGPAGGQFRNGDSADQLRLDAVEFCRIVSGREATRARGLLSTEVLF